MADVRPFRALRYDTGLDLSVAISPPFDTISPEQQRALHDSSSYNAVRIELAEDTGPGRYENAARSLAEYTAAGYLHRDNEPAYYLYQQQFSHDDRNYTRTILFARLRLRPWSDGVVLPHEQTFGAPKEDRIQNMRATHLNASPVFMLYRDSEGHIREQLGDGEPLADFRGADGQSHRLARIDNPATVAGIAAAFADETLYIADGHHRYETALAYRDEARAAAAEWTGDEPENFVMVALTAADDPGLLVLPINRVTAKGSPWNEASGQLEAMFNLRPVQGGERELEHALTEHPDGPAIGLVAAENEQSLLLTIKDGDLVDRALPPDRTPEWRALDYSIANFAVMREGLGLTDEEMSDYKSVWFTEDAGDAVAAVREGRARYAVILNPVSPHRVLELADLGERMPQKSTFFYPKVPTGLVFNLLED